MPEHTPAPRPCLRPSSHRSNCDTMNHTSKKRRLSGYEDATVPPSSQDQLYLPSPAVTARLVVPFSANDIQILDQAASILQCQHSDLLALQQESSCHTVTSPVTPVTPLTPSEPTYYPAGKRQRMQLDTTATSVKETAPSAVVASMKPQCDDDHPDAGFSLGITGSRIANAFANFTFCMPCSPRELPPGYSGVSVSSSSSQRTRAYSDEKVACSDEQIQVWGNTTCPPPETGGADMDFNNVAPVPSFMSGYPVLQPARTMSVQPSTRAEGMVYPEPHFASQFYGQPHPPLAGLPGVNNHVVNHVTYTESLYSPQHGMPGNTVQYATPVITPMADELPQDQRFLETGSLALNQRPPPAKRGPFKSHADREKTAETRRIGSCIRCRMQRIRCKTNPDDKSGACLTCMSLNPGKVRRQPCLRYKITDIRLSKPGQVKGFEWTQRWAGGIADDISQWASSDTKTVFVTEGYTTCGVRLRVREFIPQKGDALMRSWVVDGIRKSVEIPPYAIVNMDEAKSDYSSHLETKMVECNRNVVHNKDRLISGTYGLAHKMVREAATEKERDLLRKALMLWMSVRLTTKSTYIVGDQTLGMDKSILDETSGMAGRIPLPPVMGRQIELIMIDQIQAKLRKEVLVSLQSMTQNRPQGCWLTIYLVSFILLHNVSLLCQHDAAYARKHGMKSHFAREDMVREYQQGADTLLAYFHYDSKAAYPFSNACKDEELESLAHLNEVQKKYVKRTRAIIESQKVHWEAVRTNRDFENDMFFVSHLYVENYQDEQRPTM